MFPADIPTENRTLWYFVLLIHVAEKWQQWKWVGKLCTNMQDKFLRKSFLWILNALPAVYIFSSSILTTCAVLSCDLRGENGLMCQARLIPPWKLGGGNANLYLYLWRVIDKLLVDDSKFLFSPPLHPRHSAAPICRQKFTSRCYSSTNSVCSHFSCRQDWGAPRKTKEPKTSPEVTRRKQCCIFVRNLTSWALWVLLFRVTNFGVSF